MTAKISEKSNTRRKGEFLTLERALSHHCIPWCGGVFILLFWRPGVQDWLEKPYDYVMIDTIRAYLRLFSGKRESQKMSRNAVVAPYEPEVFNLNDEEIEVA